MNKGVPHLNIVIAASLLAVVGYAVFSVWIFGWTDDASLRGDVAGTWKSFAVAAFAFWLGSSSGGKSKDTGPVETRVVNQPNDPVPTEESHHG